MTLESVNLLDLDAAGLAALFTRLGEKPGREKMRARQLMRWLHHNGVADLAQMTDMSKASREALAAASVFRPPGVVRDHLSADGTRKFLFDVGAGNAVETVFIPEERRGTLCISTQAGCALDCAFCSTGKQGFNRNLGLAEIIGQLWMARHLLEADEPAASRELDERIISNVVLMGMGEPLANLDNVIQALQLMLGDNAYGLSRRRVTVSTSGIVPAMDRLRDACPVALAVSLHAPTDTLRDRLVPINRKYPLAQLMAACRRYLERAPRDFVTFEYVMLAGVNDHDDDARELLRLTQDVSCKFNLIPFNPFPNSGFQASSHQRIRRFAEILQAAGVVTTTRKTRGDDIDAACGQLAGQVQDRTTRTQRNAATTDHASAARLVTPSQQTIHLPVQKGAPRHAHPAKTGNRSNRRAS